MTGGYHGMTSPRAVILKSKHYKFKIFIDNRNISENSYYSHSHYRAESRR